MIRAFIQARMSSSRFPGKVLAPLNGTPLIAHVIDRVADALPRDHITVSTSTEASDDPLACYVEHLGVAVHRGPLDDVFSRFAACLEAYPCAWFFRLCADSPYLDPTLMLRMIPHAHEGEADLVTNVFPRSYPAGQSVELVRAAAFRAVERGGLAPDQREHLTRYFYQHAEAYKIINLSSGKPALSSVSFAVDRLEDLARLERHPMSGLPVPVEE
jgi:spore coat polysaccharide biosynthesis protein SpsF